MALMALTDFDIPNLHFAISKFFERSSLLQMSLTVNLPMLYYNMISVLEVFLRTISHTFNLS